MGFFKPKVGFGSPSRAAEVQDHPLMGGDTLAVAETLWKQGDHDGAWLALEELAPIRLEMIDDPALKGIW